MGGQAHRTSRDSPLGRYEINEINQVSASTINFWIDPFAELGGLFVSLWRLGACGNLRHRQHCISHFHERYKGPDVQRATILMVGMEDQHAYKLQHFWKWKDAMN